MDYSLLVPPSSRPRKELRRKEARAYFIWFVDQIPRRVDILEQAVRTTAKSEFQRWVADKTRSSLDVLGCWFADHVEREDITEEYKQEWGRSLENIEEIYRPMFEMPTWTLSTQSYSIIHDVGMYLGEVFRKQLPKLDWLLSTWNKRDVDYHEPILGGPGLGYGIHPVGLVHTIAIGLVNGTKQPSALHEVFDILAKKVSMDRRE